MKVNLRLFKPVGIPDVCIAVGGTRQGVPPHGRDMITLRTMR